MSAKIVNVLVVEDSPVMRLLLTQLLNSDPRIRVPGTAEDGETALAFLEKPPGPAHPEFGVKGREFLRPVIAMAGVNAPVPGAANGAAIQLQAALHVLSPGRIAEVLAEAVSGPSGAPDDRGETGRSGSKTLN